MSKAKNKKPRGPKPGLPIIKVCANAECSDWFEIPSRFASRADSRDFCSRACSNKGNSRVTKTPWQRVEDKTKRRKNGCLLWQGNTNSAKKNPVGLLRVDGKRIPVHRYVYETTNEEEIPEGGIVTQTCGNSLCCSPFHLELTSRSEHLKKCQNRGAAHWRHKLKAVNVRSIRKRYAKKPASETIRKLAKKYDVSYSTVYSVIKRRTWKHL